VKSGQVVRHTRTCKEKKDEADDNDHALATSAEDAHQARTVLITSTMHLEQIQIPNNDRIYSHRDFVLCVLKQSCRTDRPNIKKISATFELHDASAVHVQAFQWDQD